MYTIHKDILKKNPATLSISTVVSSWSIKAIDTLSDSTYWLQAYKIANIWHIWYWESNLTNVPTRAILSAHPCERPTHSTNQI